MPIADVAKVIDHFRTNEVGPGSWLRDWQSVAGLSDQARTSLGKLSAALDGFDEKAMPWDVLAKALLDRTRIAGQIAICHYCMPENGAAH
jgi:hypothetical protein